MISTSARLELGAKHYLSVFTILSLMVFCGGAAFDLETARSWTFAVRDLVTHHFDWLFIYTASLVLVSVVALA
ncbi:MAG: hypothetical protein HUJ31_04775, partial [Pseudomonadales bacterium]|nr:hypothetical protein [Pseudomonadales bacterium]